MSRVHVSATIFLFCILFLAFFSISKSPSVALDEELANVQGDSYTIFSDNGVTGALNGTTQIVEFSSTDATEVVESAVEALP